jgi:hypothetical protein
LQYGEYKHGGDANDAASKVAGPLTGVFNRYSTIAKGMNESAHSTLTPSFRRPQKPPAAKKIMIVTYIGYGEPGIGVGGPAGETHERVGHL